MSSSPFVGHGTFIYLAADALSRYAQSTEALVADLKRMRMQHVWIRLCDHRMQPEPAAPTRLVVNALRGAGIALAGWGFNRGANPRREAQVVADLMAEYGLSHYVADIEQDEHDSQWTTRNVETFLNELRRRLPRDGQIYVSSYPYIKGKHPELMHAASPLADGFAPQIYWHDYPATYMLEQANLPPHPSRRYTVADIQHPEVYADLCLDWWRETVGDKPLILTGQAYWENGFSQRKAEAKLETFLDRFMSWNRLSGMNWWHFARARNTAANGTMTAAMQDAIVAARLNEKPFGDAPKPFEI